MFKQGMKLDAVYWSTGEDEEGYRIVGGPNGVGCQAESITVEMVAGHMAALPWAKVSIGDKVVMVNLFQCNDVHITPEKGASNVNAE